MARKIFPIFDKVSNLLKLSFLLHKLRKPITIPKFILLKKLRKNKEFKLLRHHHHHKPLFSTSTSSNRNLFKNRRHQDLRSFFYMYWCLGNLIVEGATTGTEEYKVEAMPMRPIENEDAIVVVGDDLFDSGDELGESVDEKAERFINRFYHEMRMHNRDMNLYI